MLIQPMTIAKPLPNGMIEAIARICMGLTIVTIMTVARATLEFSESQGLGVPRPWACGIFSFASHYAAVNLNTYPPFEISWRTQTMRFVPIFAALLTFASAAQAQFIDVEAQPLADNVRRVVRAFEEL